VNRYYTVRRLGGGLTAFPGIALGYGIAGPADCRGTSGSRCSWPAPLPVHPARISAVVAGIATWQIAVIATAALLATALAVVAGRRRRARRRQTAAA
jgi:hypothetical protein